MISAYWKLLTIAQLYNIIPQIANFAVQLWGNALAFIRSQISELPFELVTVDVLRQLVESVGGDGMKMTVCRVSDGFVLRSHVGYQARKSLGVMAEKSRQQRVFKTMDSALRVCKTLGFHVVQVEL